MKCFDPIKVPLTEKAREKRIRDPSLDITQRYATFVYVPCGKCSGCLMNKRSEWTFRLYNEVKNSESCFFITLTYDDDKLPYSNKDGVIAPCVRKKDVQDFLKRLRFNIRPFKIRYFLVSEYGPKTLRPHYHMLLFNFPLILQNKFDEYLNNSWKNGFTSVSKVTDAHINYVTSYCLDSSILPKHLEKNFMLCSKRPYIGYSYCSSDSIRDYHSNSLATVGAVSQNGKVNFYRLPRIFKENLYSEEQLHSISHKNNEFYDGKRKDLLESQRRYIENKGYEVNEITLKTPYFGSPLFKEESKKIELRNKIMSKCKNKKNG